MTLEPREHHTSLAKLKVIGNNMVEIHYHAGITFTIEGVQEVQEKRRALFGDRPHATLTIIPDDVDYRSETMRQDQSAGDRGKGTLLASAVVVRESMFELLTKLYFSYFPQLHRILVTDNEQEARSWLAAQMEDIARTGS